MKVKEHIKKHKMFYSCATTGIVFAGITTLIMRGKYAGLQRGPGTAETSVFVRPLSFLSNKMTNNTNIVTVIERETKGHPGYRVLDLDTLSIYDTQKDAAKALNAYESIVSGHIKGKVPDVNGHHLMRIGA